MSSNATTEIIQRAAEAAANAVRRPSGEVPIGHPWKCEHEHRIDGLVKDVADLDERVEKTEGALHEGNTRFIRLESKLESVSEKLGELSDTIKAATRWALGIFGTAALGWVIVNMGKGGP